MKRSLSWSVLARIIRLIKKDVLPQNASLSSQELLEQPSSLGATPEGFMAPQTAKELLDTAYRQKLLAHIWQRTSVSKSQFQALYLEPIERYAQYVQLFPASESHHHAYPGGMLDHGLEIMAYALKLRQSHLLPVGSAPETQSSQSEAWTAASSYAALLHDIGKIAVDLHVEYANGHIWHPWHGVIDQPYRFKHQKDKNYHLHGAAVGLLYNQILNPAILDWLSQFTGLWQMFICFLAGQVEHAGVLGELVMKADQASVTQELGGDPQKAMAAPKNALQRKLLEGLRYLVKETLKINQPGAGDGWLTNDALWLVSKTVTDKLRAHLLSQGISGIPEKNSILFDVLEDHQIIEAKPEGGAIWSAQVTSETGWSHQLTLIKVTPAVIWGEGERPAIFTGTVEVKNKHETVSVDSAHDNIKKQKNHLDTPNNTGAAHKNRADEIISVPVSDNNLQNDGLDTVLDLLGMNELGIVTEANVPDEETAQDQGEGNVPQREVLRTESVIKANTLISPIQPSQVTRSLSASEKQEKMLTGELFMIWFYEALISKKLIMNDSAAVVHTVADTFYLVTPGIFMRYVQEFPEIEGIAKKEVLPGWRWAQKKFEHLGVHKKQNNGHNIWSCKVEGHRKTGAMLHGYLLLKPEGMMPVLHNNPYLKFMGNVTASTDKSTPI